MKEMTEELSENENVIELWTPLEANIDEHYEYEPNNPLFQLCSNLLYYGIAFPILTILTKLLFHLKIEGKENLKQVQGGAVSISNHVHFLDCAMVGLAWGKRKVVYTTQEESFQIPFVRKLIKLLNAIPIPKSLKSKKAFIQAVHHILGQGKVVHFYPEAALWPYCTKIRKFKNGAFDFAIKNQIPVVPMVFHFREVQGIRKMWKKKPDITLTILEPVWETELSHLDTFKQTIQEKMKEVVSKVEGRKTSKI